MHFIIKGFVWRCGVCSSVGECGVGLVCGGWVLGEVGVCGVGVGWGWCVWGGCVGVWGEWFVFVHVFVFSFYLTVVHIIT